MLLELEPVAALAALGLALEDPHPVDVSVVLVANAAHHAVAVHGVDDVGFLLRALAPLAGLQEERVLKEVNKKITAAAAVFQGGARDTEPRE